MTTIIEMPDNDSERTIKVTFSPQNFEDVKKSKQWLDFIFENFMRNNGKPDLPDDAQAHEGVP